MNITFCINTARNERHHIELLFRSLYKNLSHRNHPILVYVENDNQDTVGFLKTQKEHFPNLKVIINPLPVPIGYARNINLMFEMAETDFVSYLQSDMVIGPLYDLELGKHLAPGRIVSSTRIEPPLHPPSPEKITHDFGLDPQKFDLDAFSKFAEQKKSDRVTQFWFAPFSLYKKDWLDIGGHDTFFRRSREDSDLLYRFTMKGVKIDQVWNAIVYHFTCTSSRGIEWWTEKAKARTQLQQQADTVEMTRFLRKWPHFKHDTAFDATKEYKYPVAANLKNVKWNDASGIFQNHFRFSRIFVDNPEIRQNLQASLKQLHEFANQLLDINQLQWELYKKYYRLDEDVFVEAAIDDEIVLDLDFSKAAPNVFTDQTILHLNDIIHTAEPGQYECANGVLTINRITNHIQDSLIVKNPPIDDINFTIL